MTRRTLIVLLGRMVVGSPTIGCGATSQATSDSTLRSVEASLDNDRGRKGTVWVVNRDKGELAIFDAETGELVSTPGGVTNPLTVGAGAHDICISERTGKAYITVEALDMVAVVDTTTLTVDRIPVGPRPHHIEPSHDGRRIFVSLASHGTAAGAPAFAVIDTDDGSVSYARSSTRPEARSHAVYPSIDGKTIYVSHDRGDEVTTVDAQTGDVISLASIPTPEDVIPTRFGHRLWVSSRGDGTVKRIDLHTKAITASVAVGAQPESIMLTPSERTLVVSLRGTPASLAFVDTVKLELIDSAVLPIGAFGTAGDLAVITLDGRYVYATFDAGPTGVGGVVVVDVRRRVKVDTWRYPGTGRVHGIWYSGRKMQPGMDKGKRPNNR